MESASLFINGQANMEYRILTPDKKEKWIFSNCQIIKDENGRQIQFGNGEKLFACANCRYMANADHNASINLHHIFKDNNAVFSYKDYANKNKEEKQKIIDNLEGILRPHLQKMHFTTKKERSLDVPEHPLDVPFFG